VCFSGSLQAQGPNGSSVTRCIKILKLTYVGFDCFSLLAMENPALEKASASSSSPHPSTVHNELSEINLEEERKLVKKLDLALIPLFTLMCESTQSLSVTETTEFVLRYHELCRQDCNRYVERLFSSSYLTPLFQATLK
jgi:hypothetical protein